MRILHALLLSLLTIAAAACTSMQPDSFDPTPGIHYLSPESGTRGAVVTITGAGFGTDTSRALVNFGTARARIISISDLRIVVEVPPTAITGIVTVATQGTIYTSTRPFTVLFSIDHLAGASIEAGGLTADYSGTTPSTRAFDWSESVACAGATCVTGDTIRFHRSSSGAGHSEFADFTGVIDRDRQMFTTASFSSGSTTTTGTAAASHRSTSTSTRIDLRGIPYTRQGDALVMTIEGSAIAPHLSRLDRDSSWQQSTGPGGATTSGSTSIVHLHPAAAGAVIRVRVE